LLKQSVSALKGEKVTARVDVGARFDFLALNPGEASAPLEKPFAPKKRDEVEFDINIPREVPSYLNRPAEDSSATPKAPIQKSSAFIPLSYIAEAQHRIDIYRKLAQSTDKPALDRLQAELRDRFGPLPPALELLLLVAELKFLASEKSITLIEVKEDKLMFTRNHDFIMIGGKFPRLTKTDAKARLKEIKRLLLAL
jgi:transcription-repair coupling factor (superfamily II helicase)